MIAIVTDQSRADARMFHEIESVALDFGFRLERQDVLPGQGSRDPGIMAVYSREPLNSREAKELIRAIQNECPELLVKRQAYDGELRRLPDTAEEPYREVYLLSPEKRSGSSLVLIDFVPHERAESTDIDHDAAYLAIIMNQRPGIGERIVRFFTRQRDVP